MTRSGAALKGTDAVHVASARGCGAEERHEEPRMAARDIVGVDDTCV